MRSIGLLTLNNLNSYSLLFLTQLYFRVKYAKLEKIQAEKVQVDLWKKNKKNKYSIGRFTAMSLCGATKPSHRMSYFYELNVKVLTFIKFLIPTTFGKKTKLQTFNCER